MIRLLSNDLDAAVSKAIDLTNSGRYEEARAAWKKIRAKSDAHEEAYVLGGYTALKLSNFPEAELLLREATERFPNNPYSHLYYADCARAADNSSLAVERLLQIGGGNHQENLFQAILTYLLELQDSVLVAKLMRIFIHQQFSRTDVPYIVGRLNTLRDTNPPAAEKLVGAFLTFAQTASAFERELEIFFILQILCEQDLSTDRVKYISEELYKKKNISYLFEVFHWGSYKAGTVLAEIIRDDLLVNGVKAKSTSEIKIIYAILSSFFPAAIIDLFKAVRVSMTPQELPAFSTCIAAGAVASNVPTPALKGFRSRLRIAVCVSGQLRGYDKARRTWDRIGLRDHDCHYFVHTWRNIGRKFPIPQHAQRVLSGNFLDVYRNAFMHLGEEEMRRLYPSLFLLFIDSSNVSIKDVTNAYMTDSVVVEDDNDAEFEKFNNSEKMYYKIKMCHCLSVMSGREYDLFIRIRPDLAIGGAMRPLESLLEEIRGQSVIFLDTGPYIHPKVGYVVGDQFAIADRRGMDAYAATFDNTRFSSEYFLSDFTKGYVPHVNLADSITVSGLRPTSQHGISFDGWRDPDRISEKSLYAAISKDASARGASTWDALLQAACID